MPSRPSTRFLAPVRCSRFHRQLPDDLVVDHRVAPRTYESWAANVPILVRENATLVFLTGTFIPQVTIKDKPEGVIILDRLDLPRFFRRRQPRLNPSEVGQVFEYARQSTTWG